MSEELMKLPEHVLRAAGHAARPGTGPKGETCGSCHYLVRSYASRLYLKCGLSRGRWTGGTATDVLARDAACSKWEKQQ